MKPKSKPIPYAVYSDGWVRAQAKLQGYLTEQMDQLEQLRLGLSTEEQVLVKKMEESQHVIGTLPSIAVANLANKPPLTDIKASWVRLPYAELVALAQHRKTYIRALLAIMLGPEKRHHRPAEILATDDAHIVRRSLALNVFIPVSVLGILAKDKDVWVRRRVAYHGNLPDRLAETLRDDPDEDVRHMVAMRLELQ